MMRSSRAVRGPVAPECVLSPTAKAFVPAEVAFAPTVLLSDCIQPTAHTVEPNPPTVLLSDPIVQEFTQCRRSKRKPAAHHRCDAWSVHIDAKMQKDGLSRKEFETKAKLLGKCSSKDCFEKNFGKKLNTLRKDVALRVFRSEVQPVWEDPGNEGDNAGKWTVVLPDQRISRAAFRQVLGEFMRDELTGVNGVITMCKRSTHVLLLWTEAHDQPRRDADPFEVRALVQRVSKAVGVELKASFRPHAKSMAKNQRVNMQVMEPAAAVALEDSDYASSTSGSNSPARSSSPTRSEGTEADTTTLLDQLVNVMHAPCA